MSTTEQQFDSLCNFAENLGCVIKIRLERENYEILIYDEFGLVFESIGSTPHEAMTEALRYLRRISKTKEL